MGHVARRPRGLALLATVALALVLTAAPTFAAPIPFGPDAATIELEDGLWQPLDDGALQGHVSRQGYVGALAAVDQGERLAVIVANFLPWDALAVEGGDPGKTRASLKSWVEASGAGVARNPFVELLGADVVDAVSDSTIAVARLDIRRSGNALRRELGLALDAPVGEPIPAIRQVTFSVVTDEGLAQFFVYTPETLETLRADTNSAVLETLDATARPGPEIERDGAGRNPYTVMAIVLGAALVLLVGTRLYLRSKRRGAREEAALRTRQVGTTAPSDVTVDARAGEPPRTAWEDELDEIVPAPVESGDAARGPGAEPDPSTSPDSSEDAENPADSSH